MHLVEVESAGYDSPVAPELPSMSALPQQEAFTPEGKVAQLQGMLAADKLAKENLKEGERELTTGILSKEAGFRLVVSGKIGVKEIERLIKKLELDKEILADAEDDEEDLIGSGPT